MHVCAISDIDLPCYQTYFHMQIRLKIADMVECHREFGVKDGEQKVSNSISLATVIEKCTGFSYSNFNTQLLSEQRKRCITS